MPRNLNEIPRTARNRWLSSMTHKRSYSFVLHEHRRQISVHSNCLDSGWWKTLSSFLFWLCVVSERVQAELVNFSSLISTTIFIATRTICSTPKISMKRTASIAQPLPPTFRTHFWSAFWVFWKLVTVLIVVMKRKFTTSSICSQLFWVSLKKRVCFLLLTQGFTLFLRRVRYILYSWSFMWSPMKQSNITRWAFNNFNSCSREFLLPPPSHPLDHRGSHPRAFPKVTKSKFSLD